MQPLSFLKAAMPLKAIFCCSSAEPVLSDGMFKVHNDPNRDLHDSIYTSFMNFVLRRQRQATLLQLALSHVEEPTDPFDEAPANSALDYVTGPTTTDSVIPSSRISAHPSSHLNDASVSRPFATPVFPSMIETPDVAQPVASVSHTESATPLNTWCAGNSNLCIPGNSASTTSYSGPALLTSSEQQAPPSIPVLDNPAINYQSYLPVSPPETPTPHSYNGSNLPTQTSQEKYIREYTTPTKLSGSVGLSVMALPFVPGSARGSFPPSLAAALSNTHPLIPTQLPTLYEGLRSSGTLAGNTTTTQHTIGQQSEVSELQGHGYNTAGQNSLALLGLQDPQTQPVLSTSLMPSTEFSTSLPNTCQHSANTGNTDHHTSIRSIADTLHGVHLATLQQPSIIVNATNSMPPSVTTPTNPQPQLSTWIQGRTFPNAAPRDNQPQSSQWLPNHRLPSAAPLDNRPPHQSDLTTPVKSSFESHQLVSQSVRSPTSVSNSSRQNVFLSASISPPVIMSESRGQSTFVSHNRTPSYGTPRSSSAGSWRSHAPVSNSAFSSQRPKPRSNNSYTSASSQPRTVASSSLQTQQQQIPQPTVLFDMEAAKNNPLTESTSFVIHLTSRLDYGPVESHRYFICPQNLNDDWIELTLFQWWCRGESFKMKAEKWDVKCKKHGKFFRMTLRPNLKMRDDLMPSFGASGPAQCE